MIDTRTFKVSDLELRLVHGDLERGWSSNRVKCRIETDDTVVGLDYLFCNLRSVCLGSGETWEGTYDKYGWERNFRGRKMGLWLYHRSSVFGYDEGETIETLFQWERCSGMTTINLRRALFADLDENNCFSCLSHSSDLTTFSGCPPNLQVRHQLLMTQSVSSLLSKSFNSG